MDRLKRFYWATLHELRAHKAYALSRVPGAIGQLMRRRFYRTRLKDCGVSLLLEDNVRIQSPEHLTVGDHVAIACDCFLNASGGISIAHDTYVGPGTKIWTDNHVFDDPGKPFTSQGFTYSPVVIERDVWIGARCFIKPGSTIKIGAVIRPGTVLARSVAPYAVMAGNPGKIVGWRQKTRVVESSHDSQS